MPVGIFAAVKRLEQPRKLRMGNRGRLDSQAGLEIVLRLAPQRAGASRFRLVGVHPAAVILSDRGQPATAIS